MPIMVRLVSTHQLRKLLTLLISVNVKAVSCTLDVAIDLINVFIENDQLNSYVNEKLGTFL